MIKAMSTAATGMKAQELRVDTVANNLANVNTAGFKKQRAEFQDLLYNTLRPAGTEASDGTQTPVPLQVGMGVRTVATLRQHSMGALKESGNALDIAIEGDGFFQVRTTNGDLAYTRDGSLKLDSSGRLVNSEGLLIEPSIVVPADALRVVVSSEGMISVVQAGNTNQVQVGQLDLATFINPAGLENRGHNLLAPTAASGAPVIAQPGTQGLGSLLSGFVEMSNVQVVEEMVDLIAAQRAYETNSRVIRAADEMLQASSNLR